MLLDGVVVNEPLRSYEVHRTCQLPDCDQLARYGALCPSLQGFPVGGLISVCFLQWLCHSL